MRKSGPRRTNVPSIPEIGNAPSAIDAALKALKEATEVGYGRRGDPLDRFVTMRDLKNANLGTVIVGPGGASIAPGPTGGSGAPYVPFEPPDYGDDDFTVPPAPTGVSGRGVPPDSIMVTWDPPNYSNHSHAEIYALLENPDGSARTLDELTANLPAALAGRADGTIFMHRNLVNVTRTGANPLDMALAPSVRYYWVRFVSTAGVRGPLAPLLGADAAMSIDPVLVLDAMIANVETTPIYNNLRAWIGVEPQSPIFQEGGILGYITAQAENANGILRSLWSVNMRQNTSTGLVYAAGFGIGMETDDVTGESLSSFLINANQFAIMGATGGMAGAAITGITADTQFPDVVATIYVATPLHGFDATSRNKIVIAGATGNARIDEDTTIPSPFPSVAGRDGFVLSTAFDGLRASITVLIPNAASGFVALPNWANPFAGFEYNRSWVERFSGAVMPPTSIPFIIDTTRLDPGGNPIAVVGIRGDLIVDGLVRARVGDFDRLIATNAFVEHMRVEHLDANVIVGQRIIAGGTGAGAVSTGQYLQNTNYLVELANPQAAGTQFPFRFWRPASGDVRFSLDLSGNMVVGGHMSVAGNGVIGTTGTNLASFGGAGADGNYALWCGPQSGYGTNGASRTEATGLFWIKDNGRAGFNADLFLGNNAFALPTAIATGNPGATYLRTGTSLRAQGATAVQLAVSAEPLQIRALRSGAAADTVIMVSGFLVAHNSGETADGSDKFFWLCCELIGSPSAAIPQLVNDVWQPTPGVLEIQNILLDDYSPESMPYTLMSVVRVPAGNYWVRLRIHRYDDRNMSIIQGWKVVAFQTTTSGGLAA